MSGRCQWEKFNMSVVLHRSSHLYTSIVFSSVLPVQILGKRVAKEGRFRNQSHNPIDIIVIKAISHGSHLVSGRRGSGTLLD